MMQWYFDSESGTLYFPDGSEATTLKPSAQMPHDAQLWAFDLVQQIGIADLTSEQLMWLLSMTAGLIVRGPPESDQ